MANGGGPYLSGVMGVGAGQVGVATTIASTSGMFINEAFSIVANC